MRNYWRIILSLFLIGNALSVQAAVKSFTETFVLYTDSEGLTTAYNEGWCLDGKGSGTFGYYSSRSGTFPDPLDDGTITMESDGWTSKEPATIKERSSLSQEFPD